MKDAGVESKLDEPLPVEMEEPSAPAPSGKTEPKAISSTEIKSPANMVKTGLGDAVDKIAAKSPSLQKDLEKLDKEKWAIEYGPVGDGSVANRDKKLISIDGKFKDDPIEVTKLLAHEVGHATYPYKDDFSSKSAYVNGALADEGAATLNNIKVQREIQANSGLNIRIAGNSTNHDGYNKAYDQFLKDGNAESARQSIGTLFGKGEITSNTNEPYADYYGNWYDKNFPAKK